MTQAFQPQPTAPAPQMGPGAWTVGVAQDAGGNGVAMAHLFNRTVAVVPLQLLENQPVRGQAGKFQDVIVADIFVLDGGPFMFGGSPDGKPQPTPDTMRVDALPFLAENSRIYGVVIVNQLRNKVRSGVSVGRVVKIRTGSGNDAWSLTTDPAPEQLQLTQQLVTAHYTNRTFVNPAITMLAGPQAAMYQGQPAQYPQGYGQMGGQAAPVQSGPSPSWPQGAQFTPPAQPAFQPQFQAPAQPAPADWTLTEILPGMPLEQLPAWQSQTTLDSRMQMLAAAGITSPTNQVGSAVNAQPTGL